MGRISLATGIPALVLIATAVALRGTAPTLLLLALAYAGAVSAVVALFSHPLINYPLIISKTAAGDFTWFSYLLFFPFLHGAQLYCLLKRWQVPEPLFTEICDGLFVGGWPVYRGDIPKGNVAVVDCTIELHRTKVVRRELPYLCIPSWDTMSTSVENIELAVKWAVKKRAENHPILIHCAKGHGRSVSVMCALLVALGVVSDWQEAEVLIKRHRPFIHLNSLHKKRLQEWQKLHSRVR